ncbi:unnamed protein product [Psylliodes chrysocephalus]|uniref:Uncharacterized protein n=1 Tax=Psylliodes chrysocephalus TaxID=3402493 RepID=A0A9P0GBD1_9CUCU|nr:unnamed protein product [Psylliodes chrysocephala]
MDRRSRGFKLLSLTKHPANALKDITNDSSGTLTSDSVELNKTIKLFREKNQDNHTDTKSAENEKRFAEENEELNEDNDEEDATNHPEEVDNENNDPTYQIDDDGEQHSDEENNDSSEEVTQKRKKKRFSNPAEWKYNTNKINREKGVEYMGRKNNKFDRKKTKRVMKTRCLCSNKPLKTGKEIAIQCYKLTDEERKLIFAKFWSLSWPEKKIYISAKVLKNKTERSRHRKDPEVSQRTTSYKYFHKKKSEKLMFCNTLGLSMRTISAWIKDETSSPAKSEEQNSDKNIKKKLYVLMKKR